MAAKANGQAGASTPKKINKMEAVRRALGQLGRDATPTQIQDYVRDTFGIRMSTNHISAYRSDIRHKEAAKAQAPAAAPAAPSTAPAAAAPTPAATKPAPAAKPAAKKPAAKKPAPRPQAQPAAARAAAPKGAAGTGGAAGISLQDVQAVKELVGRIGADQLHKLIDLFAR